MVQVCRACGVRRSATIDRCHVCKSRRARLLNGGAEAAAAAKAAQVRVTVGGILPDHGRHLVTDGPGSAGSVPPPLPDDADLADADPGDDAYLFDPGAHSVAEVHAYLDTADEAEQVRVQEKEAAGKARKGIIG